MASFIGCTPETKTIKNLNNDLAQAKTAHIWQAELQVNDSITIPFKVFWSDGSQTFTLQNGYELIEIKDFKRVGDSIYVKLTPYDSEIKASIISIKNQDGSQQKQMKGAWFNYAKGLDYIMPFFATQGKRERFKGVYENSSFINGKYQVWFGSSISGYPAIAHLKSNNERVYGTFTTETGDYRYLEGAVIDNTLHLSCFDGAHAFRFLAKIKGDSLINGMFYSGSHYQYFWSGVKNEDYQLQNPDSITKITQPKFEVNLPKASAEDFKLSDLDAKISLIQIMGTWCPNCKDETHYLKELHKKYGSDKLYIAAFCFEYGSPNQGKKRIETYKSKMEVPYPMFYSGTTDKKKVTDVFTSLNRVISYPTLIVLNKQQEVVLIHTGFNGPATKHYKPFKIKMANLLDSLIQ